MVLISTFVSQAFYAVAVKDIWMTNDDIWGTTPPVLHKILLNTQSNFPPYSCACSKSHQIYKGIVPCFGAKRDTKPIYMANERRYEFINKSPMFRLVLHSWLDIFVMWTRDVSLPSHQPLFRWCRYSMQFSGIELQYLFRVYGYCTTPMRGKK